MLSYRVTFYSLLGLFYNILLKPLSRLIMQGNSDNMTAGGFGDILITYSSLQAGAGRRTGNRNREWAG